MNRHHVFACVLSVMLLATSATALAGKSSDAYFVRVDRDTTTQNSSQTPVQKPAAGKDAATGLPTGKRQHRPFTVIKPLDKASPKNAAQVKKIPGMHKTGNITLKRGIVE